MSPAALPDPLRPVRALREASHRVEVVGLRETGPDALSALAWDRVDVFVVGRSVMEADPARIAAAAPSILEACDAAHRAGAKLVAEIEGDRSAHPVLGNFWKALVRTADACLVDSPALQALVAPHTRRPVTVIDFPLASPKGAPRVHADRTGGLVARMFRPEPVRLLWAGEPDHLAKFIQWADWLGRVWTDAPLQIRAVAARHPELEALGRRFAETYPKCGRFEFVEWTEGAERAGVEEADIVLVPTGEGDAGDAARIVRALRAGRHVISSPSPTHRSHAGFADLGDNPVHGLHTYLDDAAAARERIVRGQQSLESGNAAQAAVAASWLDAIRKVSGVPRPAGGGAVRLNLGCGDKVLEGYVNVDVAPSRRGQAPDVLCDLRDMSVFSDQSADEILSVHVVEHSWRWEVEDILREWLRVLKPGGRMVLECPNLAAACEAFLRDPEAASSPGPDGRMTMWVFYGDPAWRDPLMIHRWGYTPASLSKLMADVGLVDVRQEPAQFKMREPRDMRIVGRRPSS